MLLDPEAAMGEQHAGGEERRGGEGRRKEVSHGDSKCGKRQEVNVGRDRLR